MLTAPATLEALMKEWSSDTSIDATSMEKETLKISHLHSKYLNIRAYHNILLRKMETDYKMLKGLREDYYQGHLTKEDCDSRGWEYMQHVLSNPAIARKLDADPELNKLLLKKIAHEEIVSYCDMVLRSLNNRTWDLGNFIKYQQLTSGR
jgi:Recombination, repair and ssDNA binding protein UvsY